MISISRCSLIALFLMTGISPLEAQWSGWPVPTNSTWYAGETYRYVGQLYSAAVERCQVTGVAIPRHVQTNIVSAGFTAGTIATNPVTLAVFTNPAIAFKTIITTNQFEPFSYSWTNLDGSSSSATCYPAVTRGAFVTLDNTLSALIPFFCVTNMLSNGTFSAWFKNPDGGGNTTNVPPMHTRGSVFYYEGIGLAQAYGTNPLGCVTGAAGFFTRWIPPVSNTWTLASATYRSNGWSFSRMTDLDRNEVSSNLPTLSYWQSGPLTNWNTLTIALTGTCLRLSDQVFTNAKETVVLSAPGAVSLSNKWGAISSCGFSGIPPNTGDVISVEYSIPVPLYGDVPNRLLAVHLNERQRALNTMVMTVSNIPCKVRDIYWGSSDTFTNYDQAVSDARADFKARSPSESQYPYNRMYFGIGSFVYGYVYNGVANPKAGLQACTWAVTNGPSNTLSFAAQTYMIIRGVNYTTFGSGLTRQDTNAVYQSLWPNQPAEPAGLLYYFLTDIQSVSPTNPYTPIVYGTTNSSFDFAPVPNYQPSGNTFSGVGCSVSPYFPHASEFFTGYNDEDRVAFGAIGILRWDVDGGFRYK